MKVDQILAAKGADVYAVRADDRIKDAVALLTDKNIGAVMVKDGAGKVVGILSERDIVRRLNDVGPEALSTPVSESMTANPVMCAPDATVDDLMGQMTDRRIRHMPVTEGGELVGMVSIGDVVKRKIEAAEQEAQALKEYIST
ncbi:MAG: CBS domain-containing protein [Pseudomonadota bacterium]